MRACLHHRGLGSRRQGKAQPCSRCLQHVALTMDCFMLQAYFAVADRLKKNMKVKAAAENPTQDVLKEFPEEEALAHRIVKKMLPPKP